MNNNCRTSGLFLSALGLLFGASIPCFAVPAAAVTAQAMHTAAQDSTPAIQAAEPADDSAPELPAATPIPDPYIRYNQAVFSFNDKFDTYFMKPVAEFYNTIMPPPFNKGIHNFFRNIDELPTIANDLLQLHLYQFANDAWRFVINSTVGIAGFIDVATYIGLPHYQNDFGLTLAHYGYHGSAYWIWPFLGSYTIRDGIIGLPVDYYIFSPYSYIKPKSTRYGVLGLYFIDYRANLLQYQPLFEEAAIDKYIFVRNAYMRNRNYKIEQNEKRGLADLYTGKAPHRLYMSSLG